MHWRDVAFAHWRVDADVLTKTLPAGVALDRYEDEAWLSVVPFRMTGVHPEGFPVVPGFGDVREINLRTYVRVDGRRGVWFYSLDAASPLAVRAARYATGLPYFDATIETSESAGMISYASERTHRGELRAQFRARYELAGEPVLAQAGSLDAFLHERYSFFVERRGCIARGDIAHAPWQLQPLALAIESNTLAAGIGFALDRPPDRAVFSRGMRVHASA